MTPTSSRRVVSTLTLRFDEAREQGADATKPKAQEGNLMNISHCNVGIALSAEGLSCYSGKAAQLEWHLVEIDTSSSISPLRPWRQIYVNDVQNRGHRPRHRSPSGACRCPGNHDTQRSFTTMGSLQTESVLRRPALDPEFSSDGSNVDAHGGWSSRAEHSPAHLRTGRKYGRLRLD